MGLSDNDAFASIRFSLGKFNTENEVKEVVRIISELI
jgi:cysteine desulfurase